MEAAVMGCTGCTGSCRFRVQDSSIGTCLQDGSVCMDVSQKNREKERGRHYDLRGRLMRSLTEKVLIAGLSSAVTSPVDKSVVVIAIDVTLFRYFKKYFTVEKRRRKKT